MEQPLVSVGLQFFNNEHTLGTAIESILRQSYQNWELILHNDGSQDNSLNIAKSFRDQRIRIYSDHTNKKRPARLNESIALARGKYYAVMDGDDVAYINRLERQVTFLEYNPSIDLVGSSMIIFDNTGKPLGKRQFPIKHEEICRRPWAGFPLAQPTFTGKRDWFAKHCYDPRAQGGVEDQDLLLRSYLSSKFANISDILMGYREKDIYFQKITTARSHFSYSLLRNLIHRNGITLTFLAILIQYIKLSIDFIAATTGLKYRILCHRAQPITNMERQEWLDLWRSMS